MLKTGGIGHLGDIAGHDFCRPDRIHSNVGPWGSSLNGEEALLIGSCHRCGAVRDRQLAVDVDQMRLHGCFADLETFGDLGVGVAVGDFPQHIDLS